MRKMARMAMVASARENQERLHHDPQPDPIHNVPHNPYADEGREMRYGRAPMNTYNNSPTSRRYENGRYAPRNAYDRQESYSRQNRMEDRQDSRMGGEGYVVWDNAYSRMEDDDQRMDDDREGRVESRMAYDDGPSNVTDMRTYSHMNHGAKEPDQMHHRQMSQQRQIGFQHQGRSLSREDAEEWVQSMRAADGSRGGRWKTMNDVKQLAERMGITGEKQLTEFYAIINAMYSDYCKVAKKHGVDRPEFYADLAKAWIHDEDAEDNKAMLYYECIVRKE